MTARTASCLLAGLLLAAFASVPAAATAVRGANTLPSLEGFGRVVTPANAIVSTSDTFLVSSHGFDDLQGSCRDRGWTGEDLSGRVFAHVVTDKTVNRAYFTGLAPGGAGDNLTGSTATTRLYGGHAIVVADSGQVLFYDAAPEQRLLAAYPDLGVVRTFSAGMPVTVAVHDPLNHRVIAHSGGLGLYALRDGLPPVLFGGAGPVHDADTTLADFNIQCSGLAVDAAGNIYFSDFMTHRVRMIRADARVVTVAGTGTAGLGGDGGPALAAELNTPMGLAVDDAAGALYVADYLNDRVRRVDLATGIITTVAVIGDEGEFEGPLRMACSAGNLYIATSDGLVRRLSGSTLTVVAGGGGTYGPASGLADPTQQSLPGPAALAADGSGGVYLQLESLRLVLHLTESGTLSPVAGVPLPIAMGGQALWFGADLASHPAEVAGWVHASGYGSGWGQRLTSPEFSFADHPGATLTFEARLRLMNDSPVNGTNRNGWLVVQGLNTSGEWSDLRARITSVDGVDSLIHSPLVGNGVFRGEVRLNSDGNEWAWLAPTTRLRIVVQTEASGSAEDGAGPAQPDGALVLDNLAVRDGATDLVAPTDFEDGTTGGWALSAQNAAYVVGSYVLTWTFNTSAPAVSPGLKSGADFTDPGCIWTFHAPGEAVNHQGLYARLTSPWFAMNPGDSSLLVAFSGKLGTRNSGRGLACWVRGKMAGATQPSFFVPAYFVLNSGTWGDDVGSPFIQQRVVRFPDDFDITRWDRPDSMQVVFYAQDQSPVEDAGFFPEGISPLRDSGLPWLDDIRLYQLGVDRDHDGVADADDACPDSCAAGQDADGDGCVDETATMRHVESWAAGALPLHYAISGHGAPYVEDGSDFAAIAAGYAEWTTAPGTALQVVLDDPVATTNASPYDGVNLVTFEDDYVFPPNVIGVTPTLSALRRAAYDDRIVLPGQIVDADMILNPQVVYRTPSYDPGPNALDLRSIVTHEAGHFYGLAHSGVLSSSLFFVLQGGSGAASLEADDRAAVAAAYPGPDFAADHATVTGQVVRGGTGYAIPGALVTAVRLDGGGEPADSAASDYTDEGGNYALRGLAPGSYSVRVTPLDGEVGGYALTPDYISARLAAVAETDFAAEWWNESESDRDPPEARGTLTLAAGEVRTGLDVTTDVDTIAPRVVSVSPSRDTTGIRIDTSVLVNFSERIDPNSLQGALRLHPAGASGALGGTATLVNGARSLVFTPTAALAFETEYQLDLTTGLTDRDGVPLAEPYTARFTTEDTPPVAITDIQPRSAVRGSFITILGTSFDPAGVDSVEYPMPVLPGYVRGVPASVTPTSMMVRVPLFVSSGIVRVYVNGEWSNGFGLTVLPIQPVTAPSQVGDVTLAWAPTDVALAQAGDTVFAVGSGGLAVVDLQSLGVSYGGIGASRSLALTPDGKRAVVTRPATGDVVTVDLAHGSGTFGQVLARTVLDEGASPEGVAISPDGRRAYVADPGLALIHELDIDPASVTHGSVIAAFADSGDAPGGNLAISADGRSLFFGTSGAGVRGWRLADGVPASPTAVRGLGGLAVAPGGEEVLVGRAGATGVDLLAIRIVDDSTFADTVLVLGGEVRDVAYGRDGRAAFAVNSAFNLLQMVGQDDGASTYHRRLAEVATGSTPVAVAISGFGDVIAVANLGSRSVSVYRTGGTAALVRAVPATARPGDVVVLQGTGTPFAAGSRVDVGSGPFAPARLAPGGDGAAFVVPPGAQRDASVAAVDSTGTRTLGLPLRIVDPITTLQAQETGFAVMLDSLVPYPPLYTPTYFTTMTLSPDGRLIAVTRNLGTGIGGEQLDFVLVGEDGIHRVGAILASLAVTASGDQVLGVGFTPDGKHFWVAHTGLITRILDSDPNSPTFGTQVGTLPMLASANVGPIAVDPLGRYMVQGDYAYSDSLHLYTPAGVPAGAIGIASRTEDIAVSPDGRYVVSVGDGQANFGDLDTFEELPAPPPYGTASPSGTAVAIPLDGRRAVVKYPDLSIGVYNLDAAAGDVGAELYHGTPLTVGVAVNDLAPAPDGHSVLISRPGGPLALLDPSVVPPAVTYPATERPVGPMAISSDGRRLWTEGGAVTTRDSLRLVDLGPASTLALVSGGGQSGLTSAFLAQPLRFRATDAGGAPQAGAVLRFDGVQGLLPILDEWDTPLWHITDTNGEVSVRWRLSSVPGTDSLVVRVLGEPGAVACATAQAVLADSLLPPAVVSLGPADGASGLNAGTAVSATFNKAMDSTSVAARMRLYSGPNPVPGACHVSQDGKVFFLQPSQPLAYSASCSLVVETGAADHYGLATTEAAWSVFTVQSPPAVHLSSLTPPAAAAGSPVVIGGDGFSAVPSQNTVLFNGVLATVTSATATAIVANVPLAATSGGVTVEAGGSTSNSIDFAVLDPNASPGGVIGNLAAGQGIRDVAITSDGLRAYVTSPATNSLTALDIPGAQTITSVTVGLQPQGVALLPDDSRAYVANTGSHDVSVVDIRPASADYHKVVAAIPVGQAPVAIAVSALGPQVIVVNSGSNDVSLIDADPNSGTFHQVTASANTGSSGQAVIIAPDGGRAFVGTAGGTIVVIDLLTGAVTATANVGSAAGSVAISPDGAILLVLCEDGTIRVVDVAPGSPTQYQVTASANAGSGAATIVVSPDGALAYVTSADGNTVLVFAITYTSTTNTSMIVPGPGVVLSLVATIPVGQSPAGIALDPNLGAFALVCNAGDGTVTVIGMPSSLPPVTVEFDFDPNTLNLKSMGRWMTGYIEPDPPQLAGEIVVGSIRLNGLLAPDTLAAYGVGDHDGNGVPDLMVKFRRDAVSLLLPEGERVPVTVTGQVGTRLFTGTDSIRVKRATFKAPLADEIVLPGQPYTLRWEVPGGFDGLFVAVLHTFDQGATWVLDATRLANTGTYVWQVPNAVADSARIGIVLVDTADSSGTEVEGVLSVSGVFEVFGPTDVQPPPAALSFAPIGPNPARGEAALRFGLPRAAEVDLEVFDVLGRRVKKLAEGPRAAGWHEVRWSGRDAAGGSVGPGLYFVRFRAEGREFRQRLVWLK